MQSIPIICRLQWGEKRIKNFIYVNLAEVRLKFKPGLPKLSPRFTAFPDTEGLSFSKNGSFIVWVETSCYSLLFWL